MKRHSYLHVGDNSIFLQAGRRIAAQAMNIRATRRKTIHRRTRS